jgi:hypothetical protein
MKKSLSVWAAAAALVWAGSAAAATYLPVGPQTNVALATVTGGGWHQCYADTYFGSPTGTALSSILGQCDGAHLMLAARVAGSDTLLVLAAALADDVTHDTGDNNTGGVTHVANGTQWYFSEGIGKDAQGRQIAGAWGFAPAGDPVLLKTCDVKDTRFLGGGPVNLTRGAFRLCWQTGDSKLTGGWRAGNVPFLIGDDAKNYERLIFTDAKAVVPEPASWALLIAGFGMIGGVQRRRGRARA